MTNNLTQKRKRAILSPIITLKSTQLAGKQCYTFMVRPSANKYEIAAEFVELFGGKVLRVNTTYDRAHKKRGKKGYSKKADGKKAYIYSDTKLIDIFPVI